MTELPSILNIEAATLSAWPAITTALDGLWLARMARGYTKRSNSVQCLDPADDGDAPARLARMVDLFLLNDLPPIFRVTPLAGPGVVAALDAAGWGAFGETRVLAMTLGPKQTFGPKVAESAAHCRISDATDPIWIEGLAQLLGTSPRQLEILTQIVSLIAWRNAGILLRDANGETVAAAMAVNAGGTGVYHNVVTRADRRGEGFGRAVMAAALDWTRQAGAESAAIQVVDDNVPAIKLYRSLGFSEVYRYHYRMPPETVLD